VKLPRPARHFRVLDGEGNRCVIPTLGTTPSLGADTGGMRKHYTAV
jgi:hypothetical protein